VVNYPSVTEPRPPATEPPPAGERLRWLYDEHYRSLVKLASFYLDEVAAAEEVVQDAFVRLLSGRYDMEPGREAAYLRSMVLNGARSQLRRRRVRRRHRPDPPGLAPAAERAGVDLAVRDDVLAALRALPAKQAAVLVLRYYLDLSEADIARTLGIAPGSVKSHAHRGLAALRPVLEELR
jgi:RNA polymerase sigma-70 factor (sigma-E family)